MLLTVERPKVQQREYNGSCRGGAVPHPSAAVRDLTALGADAGGSSWYSYVGGGDRANHCRFCDTTVGRRLERGPLARVSCMSRWTHGRVLEKRREFARPLLLLAGDNIIDETPFKPCWYEV